MPRVDFSVFDADNHYYEAEDAFIRHVPKDMQKRCMQWAVIDGRKRLLVSGQVNKFIPNPTWNPVAKPGSLAAYFRAKNTSGIDVKTMFGELDPLSDHPEYQNREKRIEVMDRQGVGAALFFPTLGVGMQQSLSHDTEALVTSFHAFNRWLDDDWGFAFDERIFGVPMITLADVDAAVAEVEWALAAGARMVCMVPGPVPTAHGSTSPASPQFDPVWARINEAGITVAIHGGDSGLAEYVAKWEPAGPMEAFRSTPLSSVITHERQIFDTYAALICHGLFDRYPNLRFASIENGGGFVPRLLHELDLTFRKMPKAFTENPADVFKRNVWVSPFYEDDIALLRDLLGAEHLLFGSDWPHAEGLEEPTAFIDDIPGFSDAEVRKIMHDNAAALVRPVPHR